MSLLFVRKSGKWFQKNHSWGMMDQNFLSKWSKRSLSIIFIMISYNPDQNMPLSFESDHKNAPSFCQIKVALSFLIRSPNWKKNASFFDFSFIDSDQKKILCLIQIRNLSLFLDVNQKCTSIFLIWMKKLFFCPDNFSLFLLKEIFDTDGLFNLVQ